MDNWNKTQTNLSNAVSLSAKRLLKIHADELLHMGVGGFAINKLTAERFGLQRISRGQQVSIARYTSIYLDTHKG